MGIGTYGSTGNKTVPTRVGTGFRVPFLPQQLFYGEEP